MEPSRLSLAALAAACGEETGKFLRHEPSNDRFCFELLRRAIQGGDQAAWEAVVAQYRGLVLGWVRQHPGATAAREEDTYWVNRTFERFWAAVEPGRFTTFGGLAALLRYLKLCAHSVLLDEARARGAARLEPLNEALPDPRDSERDALGGMVGRELWRAIEAEVTDEAERSVAYLCLALGLKPREVYERDPDRYASVADVYRIKRNLLDRLRRSPAIREFL